METTIQYNIPQAAYDHYANKADFTDLSLLDIGLIYLWFRKISINGVTNYVVEEILGADLLDLRNNNKDSSFFEGFLLLKI